MKNFLISKVIILLSLIAVNIIVMDSQASSPERLGFMELFSKKLMAPVRGDKRTKNDLGQNVIYGQGVPEEKAKSTYIKSLNPDEETIKLGESLDISLEASSNIDVAEIYLVFSNNKMEIHTVKFPTGKISIKLDSSYENLKAFKVEGIDLDDRISVTGKGSKITIHNEAPPDRIEDISYSKRIERNKKYNKRSKYEKKPKDAIEQMLNSPFDVDLKAFYGNKKVDIANHPALIVHSLNNSVERNSAKKYEPFIAHRTGVDYVTFEFNGVRSPEYKYYIKHPRGHFFSYFKAEKQPDGVLLNWQLDDLSKRQWHSVPKGLFVVLERHSDSYNSRYDAEPDILFFEPYSEKASHNKKFRFFDATTKAGKYYYKVAVKNPCNDYGNSRIEINLDNTGVSAQEKFYKSQTDLTDYYKCQNVAYKLNKAVHAKDLRLLKEAVAENEEKVRNIIKKRNLKIYDSEKYSLEFLELISSLGATVKVDMKSIRDIDVNSFRKGKRDALIHEAVGKGDLNSLKELIERGADVNLKNTNGSTPLHIAAQQGNNNSIKYYNKNDKARIASLPSEQDYVDIINFLIEKGADVNAKDRNGYEPLYFAAKGTNAKILESLLKFKPNINYQGRQNFAPLHAVLWGGDWKLKEQGLYESLELLLKTGANPNLQDEFGQTPLMLALKLPFPEGAELLLSYGADPTISKKGEPNYAIKLATNQMKRHPELASVLEKMVGKSKQSLKPENQDRLFLLAVSQGNIDLVTKLLANSVDVNSIKTATKKPYNEPITPYLRNLTILHIISLMSSDNPDNIKVLQNMIQKPDAVLKSILEFFKGWNNEKLGEALKSNEYQIARQNVINSLKENSSYASYLSVPFFNNFFKPYDRTALHIAVAKNNLEMVKLLLKNGANPTLKDSDDLSSIDFAKIKGLEKIEAILSE